MALLFSYGTLRRGHAPPALAAVVADFRWRGAARLRGRLYDLGAYPGAILTAEEPGSDDGAWIHGELAEVRDDPGLWELLDAYEGADATPPLFRRVRARAWAEDGSRPEVVVYEYARAPGRAPLLAGGRGRTAAPGRGTLARSPIRRRP